MGKLFGRVAQLLSRNKNVANAGANGTGILDTAVKGTKVAGGVAVAGAVTEVATRGAENSDVVGLYENVRDSLITSEKKAGASAAFAGIYQLLIEIANFFNAGPDSSFRNWAEQRLNVTPGSTFIDPTKNKIAGGEGNTLQLTDEPNEQITAEPASFEPHEDALIQPNSVETLSIDSDTAALGGAAAGLTVAAATGARAIPLVASFVAAADGAWDTGTYILRGEFDKAAARATSGTVETVFSIGGFTTAALGVAAREGVEEAFVAGGGEKYRVPDSAMAKLVKDGLGYTS